MKNNVLNYAVLACSVAASLSGCGDAPDKEGTRKILTSFNLEGAIRVDLHDKDGDGLIDEVFLVNTLLTQGTNPLNYTPKWIAEGYQNHLSRKGYTEKMPWQLRNIFTDIHRNLRTAKDVVKKNLRTPQKKP